MPGISKTSVSAIVFGMAVTLSACAPATETEAPDAPVPPPPPAVEDVTDEVAETSAPEAPEMPAAPEVTEASDEEAHDHAHDEDAHDHDHDHDHGDEVAHGEAHQHGLGVMAVSLLGETISVSLEAPLANFGLAGTTREAPVFDPPLSDIVGFSEGADCSANTVEVEIFGHGDHGNLVFSATYECTDIAAAKSLEFAGFDQFSGFEIVDAVYLTETNQTAVELSPANRTIILSE